jgi:hypothetical protein
MTRCLPNIVAIAACFAAGLSCSEAIVEPAPDVLDRVTLSQASATLTSLGDTVRLTATATAESGKALDGRIVTWFSANSAVATVSDGSVVAVGNGVVAITAQVENKVASAVITVAQTIVSIRITPDSVRFGALGDTVRLKAIVTDARGHAVATKLLWKSTDTTHVRVDSTGLATAVGNGSATLSATGGAVSAASGATVNATLIEVTPATTTFTSVGDTVRFTATARDGNGSLVPVTWASAVPSRVKIDSTGLATALANGAATVVAYAGLSTRAIPVTISQVPAAHRIGPKTFTFTSVGETVQFRDSLFDARGNYIPGTKPSAWSTANNATIDVSLTGVAIAKSFGTATIYASHSGLKVGTPVSFIRMSGAATVTAVIGSVIDLTNEIRDNRNSVITLPTPRTWSSADPSVVSVSSDGIATPHKPGTTLITVTAPDFTGQVYVQARGVALGPTIAVNTTLPRGYYSLASTLTVANGATLRVDPGAILLFDKGAGLNVQGTLIAIGTEADSITFRSSAANPAPGDWGGITFTSLGVSGSYSTSDTTYQSGSAITFANIGYSTGIVFQNAGPYFANNLVHHVLRSGTQQRGALTLTAGMAVLRANTFEDNYTSAIAVNGSPVIQKNLIRRNGDSTATFLSSGNNEGGGIVVVGGSPLIEDNRILFNRAGWVGAGILLNQGTSIVRYNEIRENILFGPTLNGSAIAVGGAATVTASYNDIVGNFCRPAAPFAGGLPDCTALLVSGGTGTFDHNNFANVGANEVYLYRSSTQVGAGSNYWNTTSSADANARIKVSSAPGGGITITPILTARVGTAGPRTP